MNTSHIYRLLCLHIYVCLALLHWLSGSHLDWSILFGVVHLIRFMFCCRLRTAHLDWLAQPTILPSELPYPQHCLPTMPVSTGRRLPMIWRSLTLILLSTLARCLTQLDCIHDCVLITICLARSIIAHPPITNEIGPPNWGAMPFTLPVPHMLLLASDFCGFSETPTSVQPKLARRVNDRHEWLP